MSFDEQGSPYRPPASSMDGPPPSSPGKPSKRPGPLTAVSIITLIFGILGSLVGCCGVLGAVFSDSIATAMGDFMSQAAENAQGDEQAQAQLDAFQAAMDVQADYAIVNAVAQGLGLLVSIFMVVAGIMALRNNVSGKSALLFSLVACIPSRILSSVVQVLATIAANKAQLEIYEAADLEMLVNQMKVSSMIGPIVTAVVSVVVIGGYAVMIGYLVKSKKTKEYYETLEAQSPYE